MELDTIISPPVGIRNNLVIILLVAEDSIEEFLASRSYWIPLILFNSPVNSSCIHSWGQKNLPHTYLKYEQSFCVPSGLFCHLIQLSLPEHVTTRQSAQVLVEVLVPERFTKSPVALYYTEIKVPCSYTEIKGPATSIQGFKQYKAQNRFLCAWSAFIDERRNEQF